MHDRLLVGMLDAFANLDHQLDAFANAKMFLFAVRRDG